MVFALVPHHPTHFSLEIDVSNFRNRLQIFKNCLHVFKSLLYRNRPFYFCISRRDYLTVFFARGRKRRKERGEAGSEKDERKEKQRNSGIPDEFRGP